MNYRVNGTSVFTQYLLVVYIELINCYLIPNNHIITKPVKTCEEILIKNSWSNIIFISIQHQSIKSVLIHITEPYISWWIYIANANNGIKILTITFQIVRNTV